MKFEIGEVAIYVGGFYPSSDVTILDVLVPGEWENKFTGELYSGQGYRILWHDDRETGFVKEESLRKKKPPQEDRNTIASWDKCIWKPDTVTAGD